jgi:hypothetical protein
MGPDADCFARLFLYCVFLQDPPVARQPNESIPLPCSQFELQFIGATAVVIPDATFASDPISEFKHLGFAQFRAAIGAKKRQTAGSEHVGMGRRGGEDSNRRVHIFLVCLAYFRMP